MNKYYTRSDLAIESLAYATQDKDYKHHQNKMEIFLLKHLKYYRPVLFILMI